MYDLGNAQLMQGQPEDAIISYKTVLKQRPDDVAARHNLAIAEAMLKKNKEQKKEQKQQPPKDKQDNKRSRTTAGRRTNRKIRIKEMVESRNNKSSRAGARPTKFRDARPNRRLRRKMRSRKAARDKRSDPVAMNKAGRGKRRAAKNTRKQHSDKPPAQATLRKENLVAHPMENARCCHGQSAAPHAAGCQCR